MTKNNFILGKPLKQKIICYLYGVYAVFLSYPTVILGQDPSGPTGSTVSFINYLKVDNIEDLLEAILAIVLVLATPIIIFFIIYSGFLYVTAGGDMEKLKKAKQALLYSILGGVLVLGAFAIGEIIKNLVGSFAP